MTHPGPAARRHIQRHGRDVEVTNFEFGGSTDKYGDPDSFTTTTTQAKAIKEQTNSEASQVKNASGSDLDAEATFYLKDDVEVHEASEDDAVKATRIKDTTTSHEYKAISEWNDGNGVLAVLVAEVK